MTPGTTVHVRGDRAPFTGTVVRLDPEFFDTYPADDEVAVATMDSTWPCIVKTADCEEVHQ